MNYIWNKLEDNLNPILFKDIRRTVRAKEFIPQVIFLIFVYVVLFLILMICLSKTSEYLQTCYKVLTFLFFIPFIVIPLEVRKLAINEVSDDNIYFIFMSNITASKYILGKYKLGLFYHVILLIAALPIYFFIYYVGSIETFKLIRLYLYTCFAPLPVILFLISEGTIDGRGNKTSIYSNGIANFVGLLFTGYLFVELVFVCFIRDIERNVELSTIVLVDMALWGVSLILTAFVFLFLYSNLTRLYPLSEAGSSAETKRRKGFSFKRNDEETQKSIKTDNNSEPLLTPINSTENKLRFIKKERTSTETLIKYLFTAFWMICLFLVYLKDVAGQAVIGIFFFIFPFVSVYIHSREKNYDNRSKLEIPSSGLKRIIKFPFVSGYVNGVVWLSLMCLAYMIVLFMTFGVDTKPLHGYYYRAIDCFEWGYAVLLAFILNIFSWCFLGRFIAEKILKEDRKDNKPLAASILLLIGTSLCSGMIPKRPEYFPYTLLNYFAPTMPSFIEYFFFNNLVALGCNILFFIVTIIPNINSLYTQAESYFSYKSDLDE